MIELDEIVSIEEVEPALCMDIWNFDERCQDSDGGNFILNNVIVHNSIPEVIANRDDPRQLWKEKMDKNFLAILEPTYGKIVYQEQLTALWQNIAGFTGPEAQEARKAVAKKWTHKLKDIEKKWIEGAGKMIGEDAAKRAFEEQVSFGRYAFNKSHAVAYTLLAFRCLWLKAHFAPEFWAATMSDCHPDKLIRYMGVARSEEWQATSITYSGTNNPENHAKCVKFNTLDVNNLQIDFSVTGDRVNQGLIGIKGIGDKAAEVFAGKGSYKSLDEFIAGDGRVSKTVLERFIKLGAFREIEGHHNSKALWVYYQYHHCSGIKELKTEVNAAILKMDGWDDSAIRKERERQESEYRKSYPKRNKMPPKIAKWMPTICATLNNINKIYAEDYTLKERLDFQNEYIGYYIDNPLEMFKINGNGTIIAAKERAVTGHENYLEVMIEKFEIAKSKKNDSEFGRMTVNDGLEQGKVFIWGRELARQDHKCLEPGTGVFVPVEYDPIRKLFNLPRGESIVRLKKI
jgi:DNA polymerase III alpha subunit